MLLYTKRFDCLNKILFFFGISFALLIIFILYEHWNRSVIRIFNYMEPFYCSLEDSCCIHDCIIQTFIYHVYLCASVCILAVDLSFFNEKFKKTETHGISVMDLGAAFFIQTIAFKSKKNFDLKTLRDLPHLLISTFKRNILMLLFGSLRLLIYFSTNIPMDSTFGKYWNFFLLIFFLQVCKHRKKIDNRIAFIF
jgi:hypothetical protein